MIKISQTLVFHFTTPFSGCLQRSNIYKGAFFAKILNGFKLLTLFAKKKLPRRRSTGLKLGFWLRVWNIELTLVTSLQIKPIKCSAGKYVWHRFWKGERWWWDSTLNECLCRSSRPKGSSKKVLWGISQNSQENISFLIK